MKRPIVLIPDKTGSWNGATFSAQQMMTAVAGKCKIKRKSSKFCCFFCQQQFREMGDYRQDLGIFETSRCQLLYNIARPQYSNEYLSVLYIRKNPRLAYRHNVLNVKVIVIADVQKCRREIAAPAEDMSLFLVACCTNCWQLAQMVAQMFGTESSLLNSGRCALPGQICMLMSWRQESWWKKC